MMRKISAWFAAGLLVVCIQANAHEGHGVTLETEYLKCSFSDEQIKKIPSKEEWRLVITLLAEDTSMIQVAMNACILLLKEIGN